MNIIHEPRKGYSFITDGGDIDELARELNRFMLPHIPQPMDVPKVRGAVKAFWFSWSNGQAAWDAVAWKDFPWHLDGAGFFVFLGKNAMSPLNKLWSATEMNYVARKMDNHPGYYGSPESANPRRRAASGSDPVKVIPRRIQDALDELGIKADGGYFSTGTVFTAWWHQNPVAVLDYQAQTKTWALRPKGQKGPRFDWNTMSTSGVSSRRVAGRWLASLGATRESTE